MKVYGVYENADSTEGRGPDVLRAIYESEDDAWAWADRRGGVMGRCPDEGWYEHFKKHRYADVFVKAFDVVTKTGLPLPVIASVNPVPVEHPNLLRQLAEKLRIIEEKDKQIAALQAELSRVHVFKVIR